MLIKNGSAVRIICDKCQEQTIVEEKYYKKVFWVIGYCIQPTEKGDIHTCQKCM